jgi:hypothetical protein
MRVKIKNREVILVFNVLISATLYFFAQDYFPKDYNSYFLSAVFTFFCAASLFSLNKTSITKRNLIAFVVSVLCLNTANQFVKNMRFQTGDATFGVSNTVYYGRSLNAPIVLTLLTLFIGLFLGCINALNNKKYQSPEPSTDHSFKFWKLTNVTLVNIFLIYCLVTALHVSSKVQGQIKSFGTNLSFDFLNFATWQKFHDTGLDAMKDFWYPYGGMIWFQDSRLGPILVFISTTILLTCFLYPVIRNRKINIYQMAIMICLNYLVSVDWFNAMRYALPFVSVLIFIRGSNRRSIRIILSFPLSLVWWLSPEVASLCALIFLLEFTRIRFFNDKRNPEAGHILDKFKLPLLSLFLFLAYSLLNSSLVNTLNFLIKPFETSQLSSSIDFGIGTENLYYKWSNLALQLILIGALIGLIKCLIDSHIQNQRFIGFSKSFANNFTLTLFISYFLLKDSTRSGMLVPSLFCVLIFILFEFSFKQVNLLQKQILISLVTHVFLLGSIFQPSIQGISELNLNIKNTFFSQTLNTSSGETKIDPEVSLAIRVSGDQNLRDEIFVLGDRSTFYWGTERYPYWTISNWSTFSDQERLLQQLKQKLPTYIYLDKRQLTLNFDRVPALLRNTSTYRWVIENYSFQASLNEGDLLVKSPTNSSQIDWSYWNQVFGTKLDIRHLGNAFSITTSCLKELDTGNDCEDDLYISTSETVGELNFKCRESLYELKYLNQRESLFIPKNRIWFWRDSCKLL